MDPLDCLIEDCWQHVFKFLPAGDKHSLCQTCTSFQAMLEPQKVNWAFELVLPHILNVKEFKYYWKYGSQQIVGFSWRLVCKSWKVGFDNYCTSSDYNSEIHALIRNKYNFCDVTLLEKFLTVFKEQNGNPLIGRRVNLMATFVGEEAPENEDSPDGEKDVAEDERLREIRERILKNGKLIKELVLKYGKEIEHLTVSHYNYEMEYCSHLDACKFLQFVICHTPNLQNFVFSIYCSPTENADLLETQVTKYIELNPLPKVPRLREIGVYGNPSKLETLILEAYGQNLQSLCTSNISEISVWSNMTCLNKLHLFNLTQSEFNNYETFLRALQSPLESLYMSERRGTWDKPDKFFEIDKFLLAIQHLPLKNVAVRPDINCLKESAPFPANFPRHPTIESLRLDIFNSDIISFDFIAFLPKLKNLMLGGTKIHLHLVLQLLKSCITTN